MQHAALRGRHQIALVSAMGNLDKDTVSHVERA